LVKTTLFGRFFENYPETYQCTIFMLWKSLQFAFNLLSRILFACFQMQLRLSFSGNQCFTAISHLSCNYYIMVKSHENLLPKKGPKVSIFYLLSVGWVGSRNSWPVSSLTPSWCWCYPLLPRDGSAEELHGDSTVGPRPKVWIRDQKIVRRRGLDAGQFPQGCKKNFPSVLSCIGKRTREGYDRGSEVGTVHSGRDREGPGIWQNREL